MIIDRVEIRSWNEGKWPFTVPAIKAIAQGGLDFELPVTFFVGENGTGKSTIVEAIAEAFKIDVRGGHGGRRYASTEAVGEFEPSHPVVVARRHTTQDQELLPPG